MSKKVTSIIIRSKNEAQRIERTLKAVRNQAYDDIEVILVDNESCDSTVEIARPLVDKIISIKAFRPGEALNQGIQVSNGEYLVFLSAHCTPLKRDWLKKLTGPLEENHKIAGVYGRQVPTTETSALDWRDLVTTFGSEDFLQKKNPMFHNANSVIRRREWERNPFDALLTNVEDRLWASNVYKNQMYIYYSAEAIVDHWHGINHAGDPNRAESVTKVLKESQIYGF